MTQNEMFAMMLVTILMGVAGIREISGKNFALGMVLVLIPMAGWTAVILGRT